MVRMDSRLLCMGACMLHSRMEKDLKWSRGSAGRAAMAECRVQSCMCMSKAEESGVGVRL